MAGSKEELREVRKHMFAQMERELKESLDQKFRSDYAGMLRAVEGIAEASNEGWAEVNEQLEKLMSQDEKKFRHLNWYLRDWSVKCMEKASPVMSLDEVKAMLAA